MTKSPIRLEITEARKSQSRLRLALFGGPGAGKTLSALRIARGFTDRIGLIDTEHRSASLYANRVPFSSVHIDNYEPETYVRALIMLAEAGYPAVIIDSISHEWEYILDFVNEVTFGKAKGNKFIAWKDATPRHNKFVEAILAYPGHVIATIRAKQDYAIDTSGGKAVPVRIGLGPKQREGLEYEFDLVMSIDREHMATVLKDRTERYQDVVIDRPGEEFGRELAAWLAEGEPLPPPPPMPTLDDTPTAPARPAESVRRYLSPAKAADLEAVLRARDLDPIAFARTATRRYGITALTDLTTGEAVQVFNALQEIAPAKIEDAPPPPPAEPAKAADAPPLEQPSLLQEPGIKRGPPITFANLGHLEARLRALGLTSHALREFLTWHLGRTIIGPMDLTSDEGDEMLAMTQDDLEIALDAYRTIGRAAAIPSAAEEPTP